MITYSICTIHQISELQKFIHDHWAKDHILSQNINLLLWQHGNSSGVDFVMARNGKDLVGILGFIRISRYDPADSGIWLAMWKSLLPGVGMGMLKYLDKKYKPSSIGSIGINPEVSELYQALGWQTGKLGHYLFNGEFGDCGNIYPVRPMYYLDNKYLHHPFRKYQLIIRNDVCYVYRLIHNFVRIFDIFRLDQRQVFDWGMMPNVNYIDCLCYGIPEADLLRAGFTPKPTDLISPVFTEPLIMEHRDILFAYRSDKPYVMFKGHSDQDRPNQITI